MPTAEPIARRSEAVENAELDLARYVYSVHDACLIPHHNSFLSRGGQQTYCQTALAAFCPATRNRRTELNIVPVRFDCPAPMDYTNGNLYTVSFPWSGGSYYG